jgi:ATP-binding cassette subfamily C protein
LQNIVSVALESPPPNRGLVFSRWRSRSGAWLLASPGPTALFDVPWIPLYLAICFAFHFWIGITGAWGRADLIVLTVLTEAVHSRADPHRGHLRGRATASPKSSRRNAEVLRAMGMGQPYRALWGRSNAKYLPAQQQAADVAGGLGAASKVLRMILQSAVLAVGAYLVIQQQATGGSSSQARS